MTEIINNYLSPTNFSIEVSRIPNVQFFTNKLTIPGITASPTVLDTPLAAIYYSQDKLTYGDLDMSFIVDENMNNYKEILSWMEGMGSPESTKSYSTLSSSADGIYSDISVIITNSHRNPNLKFTFTNCFPVSLGSIELDVNVQDISYATCSVTMRYDLMKMEQL